MSHSHNVQVTIFNTDRVLLLGTVIKIIPVSVWVPKRAFFSERKRVRSIGSQYSLGSRWFHDMVVLQSKIAGMKLLSSLTVTVSSGAVTFEAV
jgi:hypothetical protein